MNKLIALLLACIATLSLSSQTTTSMKIYITINNGKVLEAELVDNASARALTERLQSGNVTYESSPYGNFESVGDIGFRLPTVDTDITTQAGDVILYQGHNICLYYSTNRWTFTRLGRIVNASQSELQSLLGGGPVTVTLSLAGNAGVHRITDDSVEDNSHEIYSIGGRQLGQAPDHGVFIKDGVKIGR